jgi:hypothetical protein
MSDTTPTSSFSPGTNAYAGIRADERTKILTTTRNRVKGRGEVSNLAGLAKLQHSVLQEYDASPQALDPIVEEIESLFGSIIARLNVIADERAAAAGK